MVNASDHSNRATESSARAGHYVTQTSGYRAFVPVPLPPTPPVQLVGDLQRSLSEADRAFGALGWLSSDPAESRPLCLHVRSQGSLTFEPDRGPQSSLQDLLAAEAHILGESLPRDMDEVSTMSGQ
jgi:hypothetical protein